MWFWPNPDEMNDFPDPVAFDAGWSKWPAEMNAGPSVAAEIFSREYVQNSWDSIRLQNSEMRAAGRQDLVVSPASIEFRFIRLTGDDLRSFLEESGVGELRARYQSLADKDKTGSRLSLSEFLTSEDEPESLTVLVCSEYGGVGMFGHWYTGGDDRLSGSRMKYALVTSRGEKGDIDNGVVGGSWGHGKKAIAGGSKCRVLLVNTAFVPRANPNQDDPGAMKRFLGVAYWKAHAVAGRSCAGIGLLGSVDDPADPKWMEFRPLENKKADELVSRIACPGLEVRDPLVPGRSGTTYVVVEPSFDAEELGWAIKRNWWPLLLSGRTDVSLSVVGTDGSAVALDPETDANLAPFIRAYRLARNEVNIVKDEEFIAPVLKLTHGGREKVFGSVETGTLALTTDRSTEGWSWHNDHENVNVVCLVRGEMVVGYKRFPKLKQVSPPFVRGTFFVDATPRKNDVSARILRLTEPHLHDEWRTKADAAVAAEDAAFAAKVLDHVHKHVRDFHKSLRTSQNTVVKSFPEFSKFFRVGRKGAVRPRRPKLDVNRHRYFSIQQISLERKPDPADPTRLIASAEFKIGLRNSTSKLIVPDSMAVVVDLGWRTLEDGLKKGASEMRDLANQSGPSTFTVDKDGSFVGNLVKGDAVTFKWTSKSYPGDWTIAPDPSVKESSAVGSLGGANE